MCFDYLILLRTFKKKGKLVFTVLFLFKVKNEKQFYNKTKCHMLHFVHKFYCLYNLCVGIKKRLHELCSE